MKLHVFLAIVSSALAARNFEKQCGQKAEVGWCKAGLPRWWFNKETGKCERFSYGGCGGNENRYLTQKKCEQACLSEQPIQKPQKDAQAYIGITNEIAAAAVATVCRKAPYSGPCMGHFPRFYYDHKTNTCRPFVYGGCHNNGNNFESPIDCMHFCGSEKPEHPLPR